MKKFLLKCRKFACVLPVLLLAACSIFAREPDIQTTLDYQILWDQRVGDDILFAPLVYNQSVIIQSKDAVRSYDLADGELIWEAYIPADTVYEPEPVIVDGYLLVAGNSSSIYAVDMENGSILWEQTPIETNRVIESIASNGKLVFVARYNNAVTAYDISSGEAVWEERLPDRIGAKLIAFKDQIFLFINFRMQTIDAATGGIMHEAEVDDIRPSLTLMDGRYFYTICGEHFTDLCVYTTGFRLVNTITFPADSDLIQQLNIIDGVLYVSSSALVAVDLEQQQIIWHLSNMALFKDVTGDGGLIFAVDDWNRVHILDAATGQSLGLVDYSSGFLFSNLPAPEYVGNTLIIPSSDRIYAVTFSR